MHPTSKLTYAMTSSSRFGVGGIKAFRDGELFGIIGAPRNKLDEWLLTTCFDTMTITTWHHHGAEAVNTLEKLARLEEAPF